MFHHTLTLRREFANAFGCQRLLLYACACLCTPIFMCVVSSIQSWGEDITPRLRVAGSLSVQILSQNPQGRYYHKIVDLFRFPKQWTANKIVIEQISCQPGLVGHTSGWVIHFGVKQECFLFISFWPDLALKSGDLDPCTFNSWLYWFVISPRISQDDWHQIHLCVSS